MRVEWASMAVVVIAGDETRDARMDIWLGIGFLGYSST